MEVLVFVLGVVVGLLMPLGFITYNTARMATALERMAARYDKEGVGCDLLADD